LTEYGGVPIVASPATDTIHKTSDFTMDVNDQIHAQLVKSGVRLAATLPDDWVNSLIRRVAKDNVIRHVSVGREAETIAVCAGAFFGGVRAVAIIGNTGLLTCTGEMATLCLRHAIPVFCIVSGRGSIDDHKVYQEVQGRRTIPLLQAYDYPYKVIDKPDEIASIPDAYEWHRLQKRPFVLFLTKKLLGVKNA
jgi:sulfopyruvate decarboxylase subunit alpha